VAQDHIDKLPGQVGSRIRVIRMGCGLTLNELARLTGISAPALSSIETGKRDPRLTTLAKIASALRVSVAGLVPTRGENADSGQGVSGQGYDLGDYL